MGIAACFKIACVKFNCQNPILKRVLALFTGVYSLIPLWIFYLYFFSDWNFFTLQIPEIFFAINHFLIPESGWGNWAYVWYPLEAVLFAWMIYVLSVEDLKGFPICEKCHRYHSKIEVARQLGPVPISLEEVKHKATMREFEWLEPLHKCSAKDAIKKYKIDTNKPMPTKL